MEKVPAKKDALLFLLLNRGEDLLPEQQRIMAFENISKENKGAQVPVSGRPSIDASH